MDQAQEPTQIAQAPPAKRPVGRPPKSADGPNYNKRMPGQPYKRSWARDIILLALNAETVDNKGRKTRKLRLIIDRLLNAAIEGQQWAIQEVLNRVDGKPAQMIGNDPNNPMHPSVIANFGDMKVILVDALNEQASDEPKDITPDEGQS